MLEAQETLRAMSMADWPNMKRSAREELHRKIHKAAYPVTYSKPVTVQELAKMLGLGKL
jgi:hypothetical protein